jgi:tRNA G10  N-methylase Trm11
MLNLALYSSSHFSKDSDPLTSFSPTLNLLDPLCGRGTTLFEGLLLGLKGYGIESNKTAVSEGMLYLERYLKEGKYKHQVSKGKVIHNKKHLGEQIEINIGHNKKEVKQKQGPSIRMMRGDALNTHLYYKKNSMDFIVSDLPYGIRHFNQSDQQQSRNLDRHSFLDQALTSWTQVIKTEGIIALSWNTFTFSRADFSTLLMQHGFTVFDDDPYLQFHHRVSQAIERDVIIAQYQGSP